MPREVDAGFELHALKTHRAELLPFRRNGYVGADELDQKNLTALSQNFYIDGGLTRELRDRMRSKVETE
jgi:hypothetical protein